MKARGVLVCARPDEAAGFLRARGAGAQSRAGSLY